MSSSPRVETSSRPAGAVALLASLLWIGACSEENGPSARRGPPEQPAGLEPEVSALVAPRALAVEANPADAAAWIELGLVYEANQVWRQAADCFAAGFEADPSRGDALNHAAFAYEKAAEAGRALELLREHAPRFGNDRAVQFRLGHLALQAGELALAQSSFAAVRDALPGAPEGYAGLGTVLLREGEHERAALELERAVAIDPEYKSAWYQLGLALRELGRADESARALQLGQGAPRRKLLDGLDAKLTQYVVGRGEAIELAVSLLGGGQPTQALALLEKLLAKERDDAECLEHAGVAHLQLGRAQQAVALLEESRSIDDGRYSVHANLALAHLEQQQAGPALAAALRAVELAPRVAQAHKICARAHTALGDFDSARAALERAAELAPRDGSIQSDLAMTYLRLDRLSEAVEAFESAAFLQPDAWEPLANLAQVYDRLGQPDDAQRSVRAALERSPGNPQLEALAARLQQP